MVALVWNSIGSGFATRLLRIKARYQHYYNTWASIYLKFDVTLSKASIGSGLTTILFRVRGWFSATSQEGEN